MTDLLGPEGDLIDLHMLSIPRARAFADALADGANDYAQLIECRTSTEFETVVLEVEVELGQIRVHPILHRERLAVAFPRSDAVAPEVLALRADFPAVPHLNLRVRELPRSLCLYDEPFPDLKKAWTAPRFIERIREWLALTAKGRLHQDDQPLEPLFISADHAILPDDLFDDEDVRPPNLTIQSVQHPKGRIVLILAKSRPLPSSQAKPGASGQDGPLEFIAAAFRCASQSHGIIKKHPTNLTDLHVLASTAGTDLLGELRTRLRAWGAEESMLRARVLLVLAFPKTREAGGDVEATDVWTFLTSCTLSELGEEVGLWEFKEKERGQLLHVDESRRGQSVEIGLLHSHFSHSRRSASYLDGEGSRFEGRIVAVGAGALGSQVVMHLVRAAYGEWTVIDDDLLLPHNLSRHALAGAAQGFPKAQALATFANTLIDGEPIVRHIVADLLAPGEAKEQIEASLAAAAVVLDMSASVTVARHLGCIPSHRARRISVFLTPTGEDLVLLAEDGERSIRLDSLEMQYYRAVADDPRLADHFRPQAGRRRYGQSCRDVTSDIPQELVALHAATASRALKSVCLADPAVIVVWRTDPDGNVRRVDVEPAKAIRHTVNGWTVCTDERLVRRLAQLRVERLPNETGGTLLGSFDLERRLVYIVDTIPSPPDSQEWPTLYIRGCRGLLASVEEASAKTNGMLEYVGEWHSHPDGYSTGPSADDLEVFEWLTELMKGDGLPSVMMIVGEGRSSCYVDAISTQENLFPEPLSSG